MEVTRKCCFTLYGETRTKLADLCEASGMEGRDVVAALIDHAHDNLTQLRDHEDAQRHATPPSPGVSGSLTSEAAFQALADTTQELGLE